MNAFRITTPGLENVRAWTQMSGMRACDGGCAQHGSCGGMWVSSGEGVYAGDKGVRVTVDTPPSTPKQQKIRHIEKTGAA